MIESVILKYLPDIFSLPVHVTGFEPSPLEIPVFFGATTLSILTLSITILSIMMLSIMTLSIMTLSIMTLSMMTLSIITLKIMNDT
jgi:hypothetical protein